MKIINCEQGTPEWLQARMGIPTASEFDNLVTPLWKPRESQGVDTYLARKLAERWLGYPLSSFSGGAMEQGTIKESEAIPWYELKFGCDIRQVGFVTDDAGHAGCSPDGMFVDGTGIEVKCPEPHTHVKYLLAGSLPKEYAAQVQGSMYVTGATTWKFLSYCPMFPPLLLTIDRDDKAMDTFCEVLPAFCDRLDKSYQRLLELNGGTRAKPMQRTAMDDYFDIDWKAIA